MSSVTISAPVASAPGSVSQAACSAPAFPQRTVRDLRASLADGAGWGAMVGFGETYFSAFALAIGLGELVAGLVASLPLLAGGVLQTISPLAIRRFGSHKRWVVCCATLQALTFFPLAIAALWGRIGPAGLLWTVALYWAAGLATGPAWNTWIGTLVPRASRAGFFASRTRTAQACVLLGFLAGGLGLHSMEAHDRALEAFAVLFAVAGLCRLGSVWMLTRHSEPTPILSQTREAPWRQMRRHLAAGGSGQLLVFLVVVQAAVQMSGPYFAPFMLEELSFSYGQYVLLISAAYLTKVIALPLWGRVAQQIGARRLLWVGSIGIMPLSAGWILSQQIPWLLSVQMVSGVVWGAYELAFFLLFFESIADEERTSLLTTYNLMNSVAWVAGSLVGGLILFWCGASYQGYLLIFGLSSAGRLLALTLLVRPRWRSLAAAPAPIARPALVHPNVAAHGAPALVNLSDKAQDAWAHTAS